LTPITASFSTVPRNTVDGISAEPVHLRQHEHIIRLKAVK